MQPKIGTNSGTPETIEIPWQAPVKNGPIPPPPSPNAAPSDSKLLQAVVRAHAWLRDLKGGKYSSIEDLADAAKLHPKVVRKNLRLAFLAPSIMASILEGRSPISLPDVPQRLPLGWGEQIKIVRS